MIQQAAAYFEQKNYAQSANICQQILKTNPHDSNALHLLGVINYQTGNYAAAENFLESALQLSSDNIVVLQALAASRLQLKKFNAALQCYQQILTLDPKNISALQQQLRVSLENKQIGLEEYQVTDLLKLANTDADSFNLAGLYYQKIGKPLKARQAFQQAVKLNDSLYAARLNLASLLQEQGEFEYAETQYQTVIDQSLQKNIPEQLLSRAHYNRGLIALGEGRFHQAWLHLSKRPKFTTDTLPQLSELKNKTLLIIGEEGLGDELLFLRFVAQLQKHNRLIYFCNPKLKSLLQTHSQIDEIITEQKQIPACEHKIALMDLPGILQCHDSKDIPPALALTVSETTTEPALLKNYHPPFIGVSWRAGLPNTTCSEKSLSKSVPLQVLIDIFSDFRGTLVILQRDPDRREIEFLHQHLNTVILDAHEKNQNLQQMLLLLNQLHGYVGVSNTNIHLYGSLQKQACVIIPQPGEWRWLYCGDHSPWYPEFTLARQTHHSNWENVIAQCKTYLHKL